jgi:hypothetical protein
MEEELLVEPYVEEAEPRATGYEVRSDYPHFSQMPHELILNPRISIPARLLYGILHKFCRDKSLKKTPWTFVSQKTIGELMNRHASSVCRYMKELERWGWITVKRRGLHRSNIVTLHARRKRRRMHN